MSAAGKPWAKNLANVMKLMRELRGMGLREHARELKLSPATLSRIEAGKGCDMDTLMEISARSGAKITTLLGISHSALPVTGEPR